MLPDPEHHLPDRAPDLQPAVENFLTATLTLLEQIREASVTLPPRIRTQRDLVATYGGTLSLVAAETFGATTEQPDAVERGEVALSLVDMDPDLASDTAGLLDARNGVSSLDDGIAA